MKPASKRWLIVGLLLALILGVIFARAAETPSGKDAPDKKLEGSTPDILNVIPSPTRAIALLQQRIESLLQRTHTPGAGVAIVRRDGTKWIAGLGLADVATKRPVTPDTLFRIASVSKGFVALSLLKLEEEGKITLQDTLKSRAPGLDFSNPWESTDPVRLVHLLEHTSGWDDNGFREPAFNPEKEATLEEGLALRPLSRLSRWKPGTRFAYSSVGPAAAAYVVEKVTGQRFEDYVRTHWFRPLQMTTASYVETPEVDSRLTKLYRPDGTTVPYWKDFVRPSGSINASTREMANYIQFYINRGSFDGVQLLAAASIDRMERASSTYAAREGLEVGYGAGNYATVRHGWVYHGHDGGIEGATSEMAYLPAAGVGYIVMINTSRSDALAEIGKLISDELTQDLPLPIKPPAVAVSPAIIRQYSGWYELASPRYESIHFITRLLSLSRVKFSETKLIRQFRPPRKETWLAVSDRLFRREEDPVSTLALIKDQTDGILIQTTGGISGVTLRRIPGWQVALQLGACALIVALMFSTVAFSLVWIPRKLRARMRGNDYLSVRTLPLLAILSLAGLLGLMPPRTPQLALQLGSVTPWSLALFFLTLALPALAVAGVVQALRHRPPAIGRIGWWHAFLTSIMMTVVSAYLAYWGAVGLRTWV